MKMNFQRFFFSTCMRNRNISINVRRNLSDLRGLPRQHKTTDLDKKFLVWTKTGNYKSVADVPEYVGQQVMEKAKNRMRIRVSNIMMALTALGCITMIISGKRAHERGESIEQMGVDWHKSMNEKGSSN